MKADLQTLEGLKLKPCPFCGSIKLVLSFLEPGYWRIFCITCRSLGGDVTGHRFENLDIIKIAAVKKWNNREECDHDWELFTDSDGDGPYVREWQFKECKKCGERIEVDPKDYNIDDSTEGL